MRWLRAVLALGWHLPKTHLLALFLTMFKASFSEQLGTLNLEPSKLSHKGSQGRDGHQEGCMVEGYAQALVFFRKYYNNSLSKGAALASAFQMVWECPPPPAGVWNHCEGKSEKCRSGLAKSTQHSHPGEKKMSNHNKESQEMRSRHGD